MNVPNLLYVYRSYSDLRQLRLGCPKQDKEKNIMAKVQSKKKISKSLFSRPGDFLLFLFFMLHSVVTIMNCPQFLFGINSTFGPMLRNAVKDTKDPILALALNPDGPPTWIKGIMAGELFLQLPFFLYASAKLWKDQEFYFSSLIYSVHVLTTMMPVLWFINTIPNASQSLTMSWNAMYSLFWIVPGWLFIRSCNKLMRKL